jgi:hypothetical protein
MGNQNRDACYDRPAHDTSRFCVQSNQPSPELLNHVGHAILRSIAIGQGDPLRHAADAIGRLERMLPDASAEARLVATLMAISSEPTPRPVVTSPTPTPSRRKDTTSQSDKQTRKSKAATPRMDASGKLLPSKEIGGVAVVSQAEARKALGVSCVQMLRLEGQKVLTRVQEGGMRHVYYPVEQVQRLIDLIDRTPPPPL